MKYKEAVEYIQRPQSALCKLGLGRMTRLMERLGNPQKALRYVHVAGTNGKGSTARMIAGALMEAGYKTGIYTSPYIHRFSERIKVGGREISEDEIAGAVQRIKYETDRDPYFDADPPTEFEIVTAIAFQHFRERGCDIVVLETGLGGRLDSTNVIDAPEAAVITTISYDHMDYLGDSLAEIAFEKAGIIKENCDVILYPQERGVRAVFDEVCERRGARLHAADFSKLAAVSYDLEGQVFDFGEYRSMELTIHGEHQIKNAALAILAVEVLREKGFAVSGGALKAGLRKAEWPGRFEIVNRSPAVLIDGAHNAEGAKTLRRNLERYFPGKRVVFLYGVLADKEYAAMTEAVMPLAQRFVTVSPASPRALDAGDLAAFLRSRGADAIAGGTAAEALRAALGSCAEDGVVCAFGSLYYIGEVRAYFGLA
jgi:dihydrofolate synthase/folylpolyglutamate synthase